MSNTERITKFCNDVDHIVNDRMKQYNRTMEAFGSTSWLEWFMTKVIPFCHIRTLVIFVTLLFALHRPYLIPFLIAADWVINKEIRDMFRHPKHAALATVIKEGLGRRYDIHLWEENKEVIFNEVLQQYENDLNIESLDCYTIQCVVDAIFLKLSKLSDSSVPKKSKTQLYYMNRIMKLSGVHLNEQTPEFIKEYMRLLKENEKSQKVCSTSSNTHMEELMHLLNKMDNIKEEDRKIILKHVAKNSL